MTNGNPQWPPCFGSLDTVFPMGADGLRCTPDGCMACDCKTECLRAAMGCISGITVREEMVDRAYVSGRMGFWERWSKRKAFDRQKNRMTREDCVKEME